MKNLLWMDVLKGIGIILVVAGHVYIGEASKYIYLVHMPLFFFIGGYLFSIKKDQKEYLNNKFSHLIIPYLSFLVILLVIPLIVKMMFGSNMTMLIFVKDLAEGIIGGKFLGGITGVFWLITVFFFAQQIMNFLLVRFSLIKVGVIVFFFLLLSYINYLYLPEYWLPFNLNVVFVAVPFFFIGYIIKIKTVNFNNILVAFILALSLMSLYLGYQNTYDMKYADYGIPFITFISSASAILVIIYFSKRLSTVKYVSSLLRELGLASMIIMYLHQPIQIVLKLQNLIIVNENIRFFLALAGSYFFYWIFQKYKVLSVYLLGRKDTRLERFIIHRNS